MSTINLNDDQYTAGGGGPVFNEGDAGIANDVTITVDRKKPEDKETAPDYKLVFTDAKKGSCNMAFWHITKDTQFKTIDEQIQARGKVFKHLLHAIYGADFQIPPFSSAEDMLNTTMKLVNDGVAQSPKFRAFANYGTTSTVKAFIQIRTWVPFLEPMSVAADDTRLSKGNFDAMERLQEDAPAGGGGAGAASDEW